MEGKFLYEVEANGVWLKQYLGEDRIVVIPEYFKELPVRWVANYAFKECRNLQEIHLSKGIESIGNHAFYNCRGLQKITLTDRVTSVGDGAFKNCDLLKEVVIERKIEKSTCLKGILSEINHEIWFHLQYEEESNGTKKAVLVFPKYLQDYIENTSAKIINQETYGSGVHYRECMRQEDIDYKKYDETFLVAEVQDTFETVSEIALQRLRNPYQLREDAKQRYLTYVDKHLHEIVNKCLEEENMERMEFLGMLGVFTEQSIDAFIDLAHQRNKVSFVSYLMNYKHKNHLVKEKMFVF